MITIRTYLYPLFLACLLLCAGEIIARHRGFEPFRALEADRHEKSVVLPDTALGWISKPGKYLFPRYEADGKMVEYNILTDGSRRTSQNQIPSNYDVILLGDSFTQGWAVSDEETFAWKLQALLPDYKIGNFGVGGYSAYQVLLMMRKLSADGVKAPVIIYGFNVFHEYRNIAPAAWLRTLAALTRRGYPSLPSCSLDRDENIVEHKPAHWPVFPLQKYTALPQMMIEIYYKFTTRQFERELDARKINKKLLLGMDRFAKNNGVQFIPAILNGTDEERKDYADFFKQNGIKFFDISVELDDHNVIPVDGHPNVIVHTYWAEQLSKQLKLFLKSSASLNVSKVLEK